MKKFKFLVIQTCYMTEVTMECDTEEEAAQGALKLAVAGKIKFAHLALPQIIAMRAEGLNRETLSPGSDKIH